MKLYRDLTEGETLQAGDLYRLRNSDMDWCEHTEEQAAEMPDATVGIIGRDDLEWRRPVDAVLREQYEKLQAELLRARGLRNKYFEASRAYCDEARRLHQSLAQAERLLHEAVEGAEPMNAELALLRQQLAEERAEHGRTAHGRDTLRDLARKAVEQAEWRGDAYRRSLMDRVADLQSQPSLQRVTAEAMAEIEQRDSARIAVLTSEIAAEYEWKPSQGWLVMDKKFWRPQNGWFIDLSTLPKVK